jgi:hypothetical protein
MMITMKNLKLVTLTIISLSLCGPAFADQWWLMTHANGKALWNGNSGTPAHAFKLLNDEGDDPAIQDNSYGAGERGTAVLSLQATGLGRS